MPRKKVKKPTRPASYTKEELAELKEYLLSERERINKSMKRFKDTIKTQNQGGDVADIGNDNCIRETGITLLAEDTRKLRMIDDSLAKLERGDFGICQDCGKIIGIARLKAKPYAKYCVDCKEAREKNGDIGPNDN